MPEAVSAVAGIRDEDGYEPEGYTLYAYAYAYAAAQAWAKAVENAAGSLAKDAVI